MNQTGQDPGNNVCSLEPIDLPKPASMFQFTVDTLSATVVCALCVRTPPALLQKLPQLEYPLKTLLQWHVIPMV